MAKIFIAKLNADTKHKICRRELSLEQLKFIYSILSKEQKRKHKAFQAAVCLTLLILAILLILTFFLSEKPDILWICFAMLAAMLVLVFILVWFLSMGYLKFQFNHLIQKHYVEYASLLKL